MSATNAAADRHIFAVPRSAPDNVETKTRLLNAAQRRFSELGVNAARLADIADDASLTTGAIYRYFPNKDSVVDELLAEYDTRLLSAISNSADLKRAIIACFEVCSEHQGALWGRIAMARRGNKTAKIWESARAKAAASLMAVAVPLPGNGETTKFACLLDVIEHFSHTVTRGWVAHREPEEAGAALYALFTSGVYINDFQLPENPDRTLPPIHGDDPFARVIRWEVSDARAEPTSARGMQTWHRIRSAAAEVFSSRGVTHSTIQDIAAHAGISPGTVYRYFTDKEDVFRSLQASVEEQIIGRTHFRFTASGRYEFNAAYYAYIDVYRINAGIMRAWWELIYAQADSEASRSWIELRRSFAERFVRYLSRAQQAGAIAPTADLSLVAEFCSGIFERCTYAHVSVGLNGRLSDRSLADCFDELLERGVLR